MIMSCRFLLISSLKSFASSLSEFLRRHLLDHPDVLKVLLLHLRGFLLDRDHAFGRDSPHSFIEFLLDSPRGRASRPGMRRCCPPGIH